MIFWKYLCPELWHTIIKKSDSIFKDTNLKHYAAGRGIYLFPLISDVQLHGVAGTESVLQAE